LELAPRVAGHVWVRARRAAVPVTSVARPFQSQEGTPDVRGCCKKPRFQGRALEGADREVDGGLGVRGSEGPRVHVCVEASFARVRLSCCRAPSSSLFDFFVFPTTFLGQRSAPSGARLRTLGCDHLITLPSTFGA